MDNIILQIKDLSASYDDRTVLKNVSLEVEKGQIVCIVGESGSGKSTLIKAVTGFKALSIDSGNIFLEGKEIANLPANKKKKILGELIGVIPQNPAGSFNPIRVYEAQIKETLGSHGINYDKNSVISSFTSMGLADAEAILKSRPYELSGGMNQRVAIASAMLLSPQLLLCDEPTSALDVTTADVVIKEFVRLNKELGTTIVMVTHNLGLARRISDQIVIMCKGEMVESGSPDEIVSNPKQDYTKQLIRDVPRI